MTKFSCNDSVLEGCGLEGIVDCFFSLNCKDEETAVSMLFDGQSCEKCLSLSSHINLSWYGIMLIVIAILLCVSIGLLGLFVIWLG